MAWIAFWITMLLLNLTDCVLDKVYDRHGFTPLLNMIFMGASAYFLLEAWKKEFGGG
jgi:hypothetical protein